MERNSEDKGREKRRVRDTIRTVKRNSKDKGKEEERRGEYGTPPEQWNETQKIRKRGSESRREKSKGKIENDGKEQRK